MASADVEAIYPSTTLSAAEFKNLARMVVDCAKSLASCRESEITTELNHLRHWRNHFCAATPVRKSAELIALRNSTLKYAGEVMSRREV